MGAQVCGGTGRRTLSDSGMVNLSSEMRPFWVKVERHDGLERGEVAGLCARAGMKLIGSGWARNLKLTITRQLPNRLVTLVRLIRLSRLATTPTCDMSLASLNSEALQLLLLAELDKANLDDTRQLSLGNGQVAGADGESQLAIKGALDSLVAREVSQLGDHELALPSAFSAIALNA